MSEHVIRRGARYYYRRRVPAELIEAMDGRKEITKALGTSDPKEAARLARKVSVGVDELFRKAASKGQEAPSAPPQLWHDITSDPITGEAKWTGKMVPSRPPEATTDEQHGEYQRRYADWLETEGQPDPLEVQFADHDRQQAYAAQQERARAWFRRELTAIVEGVIGRSTAPAHPVNNVGTGNPPQTTKTTTENAGRDAKPVTFADVLKEWERLRSPAIATVDAANRAVSRLWDAVGSRINPHEVTRAHIVAYKTAIGAAGASPTTVRVQIGYLKAVLSIAVNMGVLSSNPAHGVRAEGKSNPKAARIPFSTEDLKLILDESKEFTGARYWLPRIALYTGMRIEEIGQLSPSDIREDAYRDGNGQTRKVYSIYVSDEGEGQGLKNASSTRRIPIHEELISSGFMEYVKAQNGARLFPELKANREGRETAAFSRWFGEYIRRIGIADTRKTFHSFRHGFKDALREAGTSEDVSDALTGHTTGSVARSYGGQFYPLRPIAEAVGRLTYHL